jgi:hypothetical protein
MDNLGDWLYVILLVVAGVSGIVSSSKKKRMQQEMEREVQREILVEPLPIPEPSPVRVTARPKITVRGKKKKDCPKDEGIPEVASPVVAVEELHDPEALRKAVIYAEIFNRKY